MLNLETLKNSELTEKIGWTLVSLLICWHRELKMTPWLIRSEDDMKNIEQDWQEYLTMVQCHNGIMVMV